MTANRATPDAGLRPGPPARVGRPTPVIRLHPPGTTATGQAQLRGSGPCSSGAYANGMSPAPVSAPGCRGASAIGGPDSGDAPPAVRDTGDRGRPGVGVHPEHAAVSRRSEPARLRRSDPTAARGTRQPGPPGSGDPTTSVRPTRRSGRPAPVTRPSAPGHLGDRADPTPGSPAPVRGDTPAIGQTLHWWSGPRPRGSASVGTAFGCPLPLGHP